MRQPELHGVDLFDHDVAVLLLDLNRDALVGEFFGQILDAEQFQPVLHIVFADDAGAARHLNEHQVLHKLVDQALLLLFAHDLLGLAFDELSGDRGNAGVPAKAAPVFAARTVDVLAALGRPLVPYTQPLWRSVCFVVQRHAELDPVVVMPVVVFDGVDPPGDLVERAAQLRTKRQ